MDEPAQGDLIEWVGESREIPWQTFGVVVTADCDIAWKKNRGVLSYVPALLTDDFIWAQWRVEKLAPKLPEWLAKTAKRISGWRERNGSSESELSSEAVRAWLQRTGSARLLDELNVTNLGDRNNLLSVIEPTELLLSALSCERPDFELLKKAYRHINTKADVNPNLIAEDVQKSWATLPGDVFHLPSMPTEASEYEGNGLFLMLRHIRQIEASKVSARPDDVRSGKAVAKRVARITAPYRYAITQNLARVFADIGLPDDHEQRRREAAQQFFRKL